MWTLLSSLWRWRARTAPASRAEDVEDPHELRGDDAERRDVSRRWHDAGLALTRAVPYAPTPHAYEVIVTQPPSEESNMEQGLFSPAWVVYAPPPRLELPLMVWDRPEPAWRC